MDIEWAKDGRSGELFLVQARPETVHAQRDPLVLERFQLETRGEVLARAAASARRSARAGPVIRSAADLEQLQQGEVLVTEMTDPDWEPVMKRAAAVVTDRGGRTCHAAIVSRELGIPAIVGTGAARRRSDGRGCDRVVCGRRRRLRLSRPAAGARRADEPRGPAAPANAHHDERGNPAEAFSLSFLPNDGVGLARLEFIISTTCARTRWRCSDPSGSSM
jgi:pyruvate, water dikinase